MLKPNEYKSLMKVMLVEKDLYKNKVDLYFSIIEHVLIQRSGKSVVMIADEIDPNLIINY